MAHSALLSLLQFAAQLRVGVGVGVARPRKPSVKGGVQHLVQVGGRDEVEVGSDVGRKLLQVLAVAFREDDALHSGPVGREDLVLDAAHLGGGAKATHPVGLKPSEASTLLAICAET